MVHLDAKVLLTGEYLGENTSTSASIKFVNPKIMKTCYSYEKNFEDKNCPDHMDVP